MPHFAKKRNNYFEYSGIPLILLLFAFLLYGNTIRNGYSFDDEYVVKADPLVQSGLKGVPELFRSFYANMYSSDGESIYFGYRPFVKATFALEYSVFNENPHVSHLINIILFALILILLFKLIKNLLPGLSVITIMSIVLIYAAHPVHTEVVASLKNRDELLSLLFGLAIALTAINYNRSENKKYLLPGLIFLMIVFAYLSKPSVGVFIFLVALFMILEEKRNTRKITLIVLVLLAGMAFAHFVPRSFLPPARRPIQFIENPLFYTANLSETLATGLSILLFYIKKLVYPLPLLFYYGYDMIPVSSFSDFSVILSVIIYTSLLVLAVYSFRKNRGLFTGIMIFLISIFPYSNIVFPVMGIVGERFLFVPAIGFSIILVCLIRVIIPSLKANKDSVTYDKILAIVVMLLLIPMVVTTVKRNFQWKDTLTLMEHDIVDLQQSAKANYIYAGNLKVKLFSELREGVPINNKQVEVNRIIESYQQAVKVYPDYYQAWNQLGSVYLTLFMDFKNANKYFMKALEIRNDFLPAHYNLAFSYQKLQDTSQAIFHYKEVLNINPGHTKSIKKLSEIYTGMGDYETADRYREMLHQKE